jgi:tRNA(fMet)-specific endonuclease VapC
LIIIDTDILIEIYDKKSELGSKAFEILMETDEPFCITAINLHEALYGLFKFGKSADYLMRLLVLDYRKEDARLASEIEVETERKGNKVMRLDAMIAAIAINNNAKLYTNNKKHFSHVAKLQLLE